MNVKKTMIWAALVPLVVSAALLSGCTAGNVPGAIKKVNEQTVSMDGITNLKINFDIKNITLLSAAGDALEIRDYMVTDNEDGYSTAIVSGDTVEISAAQPNARSQIGKTAKVEIAIPESYKGSFSMSLASGEVYAKTDLTNYENIFLELNDGQMNMQKLEAKTISLDVGKGTIETKSTKGKSSCSVQSGTIVVRMDQLSDDLTLNVASGTLRLILPHDAAFHLNTEVKKGTVSVTETHEIVHVSGEAVSTAIGMSPKHTITASVGSGTVDISMK